MNLINYFSIFSFILIGFTIGWIAITIGKLLGPSLPNQEKSSPYECGFEPFEDARMKFDVRYYLVAILFILFDLEIIFLLPWGIVLSEIGWIGYLSMVIFLFEFAIGFAYIWKKGALNWE